MLTAVFRYIMRKMETEAKDKANGDKWFMLYWKRQGIESSM